MPAFQDTIEQVKALDVDKYKYGFETDIESDMAPVGLDTDTVRFISAKKGEPEWMLAWRLDAFERWQAMTEPTWAKVSYPRSTSSRSTITRRRRVRVGRNPWTRWIPRS